jgi:hypothetical protein
VGIRRKESYLTGKLWMENGASFLLVAPGKSEYSGTAFY